MLEIRDAQGRPRTDLDDEALIEAIKRADPRLVVGAVHALELRRGDLRLVCKLSEDGRYMLTHIDGEGDRRTAIFARGDPAERVMVLMDGEPRYWPGDRFLPPYLAAAVAARFVLNGDREETVDWEPSTAPL